MLCISCPFKPLKPLTLRKDHAKLLGVLTSLIVSHAILPHDVCFATSHPANHAMCSFIDSSEYASGPIRICLFIDYIIIGFYLLLLFLDYSSEVLSYSEKLLINLFTLFELK